MMKVHDAVIIGAGPSGLNSARFLAEKGLDVVVLEKKQEAGKDIICTGIVGREAFDRFELPESSILSKIQNVKMISPFGSEIVYSHPEPFAYVVDRERFDNGLASIAQENGVCIRYEHYVDDIFVHNDKIEVRTVRKEGEKARFHARVAVIATGVSQTLNKKCGLGYAKNFLNGVQSEIETGNDSLTSIYFGNRIAPGVFGWSVPIGNKRAKVGILTEKDPNGYFQNLIKTILPHTSFSIDKTRVQIKSIAQGILDKTYSDRLLLVGEAGGQVKTTTGGGIFYGLLGSEIASGIILKNLETDSFSSRDLAEYEKLWKKAFVKEILLGYYIRKVCARLNDPQIEKLFMIAKNNGVFPYIAKNGNFDWHGDLLMNLARKTPFFRVFL